MSLERFPGRTLKGGYEVQRVIGKGGFGSVFLARDTRSESLVAVKVFEPDKTSLIDVTEEARNQQFLHHERIVPVYWHDIEEVNAHGKKEEYPFIVMKYADNGTLNDQIWKYGRLAKSENEARGNVGIKAVVIAVGQVAQGVQYAHNNKILHRDLKPANILFHNRPEKPQTQDLLISDFGIAVKGHTGDYDFTRQIVKGTLPYMAPEQIDGKAVYASDQYSLGIIAYEAITGQRPFTAEDITQLMKAQIFDPPPAFENILGKNMNSVLAELEIVVARSLAKNPKDRYGRIQDFSKDFAETYVRAKENQDKQRKIIDARVKRLPDEKILLREKSSWEAFFHRFIEVPKPPKELLETWKRAAERGFGTFEAHYLPVIQLSKYLNNRSWQAKPSDWFWQQIDKGLINRDADKLGGNWILIDRITKPDYDNGQQMYQGDPFEGVIAALRKEKKLKSNSLRSTPEGSRFGISWDNLTNIVLPEFAEQLGVDKSKIRLPRAIEFNVLGNIFHPYWGLNKTSEWFQDEFGHEGFLRLVGGRFDLGGLRRVNYDASQNNSTYFGFRPLIEF